MADTSQVSRFFNAMKVIADLSNVRKSGKPIVMAAGFFDGVHRGHRKVLGKALQKADECGGRAWVMTFDVHPLKVLSPRKKPALITGTEHKLRILDELKMDACLLYPFSRAVAAMPAGDFIQSLKDGIAPLKEIVVGSNWRFGKGGKGTTRVLAGLCRQLDLELTVIKPVIRGGEPVSSTRIRMAIMKGELRSAEKMLGRPVSLLGTVVSGKRMARGLGYPTANLKTEDEVLPPFGVYAVLAFIDHKAYPAVLNFGTRPTFARAATSKPVVELHVMNQNTDLYGKELEVFFVEKLRSEKRFSSREELKKQIDVDVRLASAVLGV